LKSGRTCNLSVSREIVASHDDFYDTIGRGVYAASPSKSSSGTICIVIVAIFYPNLPRLRAAAAPALAKYELLLGEPPLYPVRED
jgi:hypothetical protein